MSNTGCKGVDVRQTGNELVFRVGLLDASAAIVTSAGATLYLYEIQSDATLKSYDFNDNTFKTTALTTETLSMTHRKGNNSTTDTGVHTVALSTLSGFTVGAMYLAMVHHSSATPAYQWREFQYGSAEGDLVVVSSGTGTAWLQSTLSAILGTGLTETVGGYLAAAFKKLFDVAAPVFTTASVNQTGDNYARLGAPAGASVSVDIAAIKTDTGTISTNVTTLLGRITSTLFSGITSLAQWLGMMAGKQSPDATALTEIKATGAGSGTYDATTDSLEAIRDRGDTAWISATGNSCWVRQVRNTTSGDHLRLEAGLVDQNGTHIAQTAGATCTVTIRPFNSNVNLLSLSPVLDTTTGTFYIDQLNPGFADDTGYVVETTIVDASSVTHGPTVSTEVVFG